MMEIDFKLKNHKQTKILLILLAWFPGNCHRRVNSYRIIKPGKNVAIAGKAASIMTCTKSATRNGVTPRYNSVIGIPFMVPERANRLNPNGGRSSACQLSLVDGILLGDGHLKRIDGGKIGYKEEWFN